MDIRPQGQRKSRGIMSDGFPWLKKSVETTHPSALIPSVSIHLFHTLKISSGETEVQRQEIAETGTHCSFVATCFLRREFPKLFCS